ncbi:PEP-CTERM sorting domain-containing protein [Crocosphaera sp.]|uniref:PEP-CTERM sorting domain-containing protein n=1 Tax=Crocosphaera sp. TaxID=2729996 RepID=UPI003F230685|nr:PEP-CTERM sorting domain-containing protein [Crocosphaera sp.]
MTDFLSKLILPTTAIALTLSLFSPSLVQAATVTYSISGTIDSGSLIDENYTGLFSFDEANLTGFNLEFLPVSTVTFNFLGRTFTEVDPAAQATVNFFNGNLLGLSYSVTDFEATFSIVPGFPSLNQSYFSYEPNMGNAGFGDISYQVVPEPLTLLGAMTAIIFGSFFKHQFK